MKTFVRKALVSWLVLLVGLVFSKGWLKMMEVVAPLNMVVMVAVLVTVSLLVVLRTLIVYRCAVLKRRMANALRREYEVSEGKLRNAIGRYLGMLDSFLIGSEIDERAWWDIVQIFSKQDGAFYACILSAYRKKVRRCLIKYTATWPGVNTDSLLAS